MMDKPQRTGISLMEQQTYRNKQWHTILAGWYLRRKFKCVLARRFPHR